MREAIGTADMLYLQWLTQQQGMFQVGLILVYRNKGGNLTSYCITMHVCIVIDDLSCYITMQKLFFTQSRAREPDYHHLGYLLFL